MSRGRALLLLGAMAGIAAAALGVIKPAPPEPDAVAWVGGRPIRRADYERALAAAAADRRAPLDATLRRHVLDRLIDEELLVARALEVGLPESDVRLRGAMARAMLESVVASGDGGEPSDAELRKFLDDNADAFARGVRVRVDVAGAPAPEGLVPLAKIADYLGASAAAAAATLPVDAPGRPMRTAAGDIVLRVRERTAAERPAFAEVRAAVREAFLRRRDDERLRRWLDRRRAEVGVVVREVAP